MTAVPPQERDLAMVFQSYALYPHKTVRQNLEFGLRMRRDDAGTSSPSAWRGRRPAGHRGAAGPQAGAALRRAAAARGPGAGHRPRAAGVPAGRAALEPRRPAARETRAELARLHRRLGATMLYVTHDQEEAMTLGNASRCCATAGWSSWRRRWRSTAGRPNVRGGLHRLAGHEHVARRLLACR